MRTDVLQTPLASILGQKWSGKDKLLQLLERDPHNFMVLIELCQTNVQPVAWRAAWLLRHAAVQNDARLNNHLVRIASVIPNRPDGHQRELLLIFEKTELDENLSGILYETSSKIWMAIAKKPSTRITAFKLMLRVARNYPELMDEIRLLTTSHYTDTLSPGIRRMLFRLLE